MFNSKILKKVGELESEVERLTKIEKEYKLLQEAVEKYNADIQSLNRSQPVAVDFVAMEAFSIERCQNPNTNHGPMTVIGYVVNSEIREWYLHVNEDIHHGLVQQFEEYRASK